MEERPLQRIVRLAQAAGEQEIAADAEAVAARLAEGRFFVACLGQFKRGKSTLLNALVGESVLPTGVTPVTAVVTVVRWGHETSARVRLRDAEWRAIPLSAVDEYVAEDKNPENEKGVRGVEVFVTSSLLSDGMCLVDTPGVGSVFESNTEATRAFVPHIDASLVVLGADPVISGAELSLVEEATRLSPRMLIVLAKADRSTDEERTQARDFAARMLSKRLGRGVGRIFAVSAIERQRSGPTRDWPELEAALAEIGRERADVVRDAEARGVRRHSARLRCELGERIGALTRPREASKQRIAGLRSGVADAERMLGEMSYLFTAVEDHLAQAFQATHDDFLARTKREAGDELARAVDGTPSLGPREAMMMAQSLARERVERWRTEVAPIAQQMYRGAVARLVDLADDFLRRVAFTGGLPVSATTTASDLESGFRAKAEFYFTDMLSLADPKASTRLAALVGARGRIATNARDYLDRLLETNTARVTNDFISQVRESRRHLHADLRAVIRRGLSAAEKGLAQAEQERARGEPAVQSALESLQTLRQMIPDG